MIQDKLPYALMLLILCYAAVATYAIQSDDLGQEYSETLTRKPYMAPHWGFVAAIFVLASLWAFYDKWVKERNEPPVFPGIKRNALYDSFHMAPTLTPPKDKIRKEEEEILRMEEEGFAHITYGKGK